MSPSPHPIPRGAESRWSADVGAEPGQPYFFLDIGDDEPTENAKAYVGQEDDGTWVGYLGPPPPGGMLPKSETPYDLGTELRPVLSSLESAVDSPGGGEPLDLDAWKPQPRRR